LEAARDGQMPESVKDLSRRDRGLVLRLVDANLDRLGEGLRVLEDVSRFLLNDAILSKRLKTMRHAFVKTLGPRNRSFSRFGRVAEDVEARQENVWSLQHKNRRLWSWPTPEECGVARVLEEFSRVSGMPLSARRAASRAPVLRSTTWSSSW